MAILLVKRNTNGNVPKNPHRWEAGQIVAAFADDHEFGTAEVPEAGNFGHIHITDKTVNEVTDYLQSWRHDPDITQILANGNDRRIQVVSSMVSATGKNAFERAPVEALLADIGGTYHAHNNTGFQFDITATIDERDEIIEKIEEAVRDMQYERRRWVVNAAGMAALAGNGWVVVGTAAQAANFIHDRLLD